MKTSEKLDQILPALLAAKQQIEAVTKGASNPHFKSKFADLNSILEEVEPKLAAYGMFLLQPVSRDAQGDYVETVVIHAGSGQFVSSEMRLILSKNDMQGLGSGVSYARRYSLQSLLGLKAEDDDGNAVSGVSKPNTFSNTKAKAAELPQAATSESAPAPNPIAPATPTGGFKRPAPKPTQTADSGGF